MVSQFFVELAPALFGKEDSSVLELDATPRSGNVLGQPMRPFHIEEHIVGSPHDQGRCFQGLQSIFDSECVLVVECG